MTSISNSILLEFGAGHESLREDLSVVVSVDGHLWVASDETTSVSRLSRSDGKSFTNHQVFALGGLIDLPDEPKEEIDIEGIAYHDNYLWIVGSHSVKRKQVKSDDLGTIAEKIEKIAKSSSSGNRYMLARIPVMINPQTGEPELVKAVPGKGIAAAQLHGDKKTNALLDAIKATPQSAGDPHIGQLATIPGKDNGFDIEGLAVSGNRIFLGLRGPVLRGWAIILELEVQDDPPKHISLKAIGAQGRLYKKHFLQLGGLGVRELCIDNNDLLVLAGPTMELDGPVQVFRWKNALTSTEESLILREQLEKVFDVPFGQGTDHAEGMTIMTDEEGGKKLLIIYDSPDERRKERPASVRADLFHMDNL